MIILDGNVFQVAFELCFRASSPISINSAHVLVH